MFLTFIAAILLQGNVPAPKSEVLFKSEQTIHCSILSYDSKVLFIKSDSKLIAFEIDSKLERWSKELLPIGTSGPGPTKVTHPILAVTNKAVVTGQHISLPNGSIAQFTFYSIEDGEKGESAGAPTGRGKASHMVVDRKGKYVWFGTSQGWLHRLLVADINSWSKRNIGTQTLTSMVVDPKGKNIALGSRDGSVRFVGMSSATLDKKKTFAAEVGAITTISYGPKGKQLFVGGRKGQVAVMTSSKGKIKQTLEGVKSHVTDIAVHPKTNWIAAAYKDGSIRIFDRKGGIALHVLDHPRSNGWGHRSAHWRQGQDSLLGRWKNRPKVESRGLGLAPSTYLSPRNKNH